MQTIGQFKLSNNGGFVCAGKVEYIDNNGEEHLSDRWDNIAIGQSEDMAPGDKGVPDGSVMRMYIDIVLGDDRTGTPYFMYDTSSRRRAKYDITGTTFNSHVNFDGIEDF